MRKYNKILEGCSETIMKTSNNMEDGIVQTTTI